MASIKRVLLGLNGKYQNYYSVNILSVNILVSTSFLQTQDELNFESTFGDTFIL